MNYHHLTAVLLLCLLAGCAVVKTPLFSGGSKADATVSFTYDYGAFEVPEVNTEAVGMQATARCGIWGYSRAIPFGSPSSRCIATSGSGAYSATCIRHQVTIQYQCAE